VNKDDRKALARARRARAKADGSLTRFRAVRFVDRKKQADKDACRKRHEDT
jgi:hypothetical protein